MEQRTVTRSGGRALKAKLFGSEHLPELLTRMSDASIAKDVNGVATKWSEQLATWLIPTHALDKSFMEKLGETFALLAEPIRSSLRKPFEQHYEKEIERMVAHCQTQRKKVPGDADNAGAQLLKSGKAVLPAYRGLLGSEAIGFQHAVDGVAEELLECAINHFNAHLEHDTIRSETVRSLVKAAGAIAHGRMLNARIEDNAKTMEEYFADDGERKEFQRLKPTLDMIQHQLQVFDNAGDQLHTITSLLLNCAQPLQSLQIELGSANEVHINLSSAVVNKAQQRLVTVVNAAQKGATPGSERFKHLLTTLDQAKDLTDRMARMAMHPNLRTSFENNQKTLQGLVFQARMVAAQSSRSTSGCLGQVAAITFFIFLGWMLT
ncbi:MAG: hypothetical protein IPK99_16015 [Flavobacteriales bacterium]|nr:hypothetical protein [Flavobacteriales bacterium]